VRASLRFAFALGIGRLVRFFTFDFALRFAIAGFPLFHHLRCPHRVPLSRTAGEGWGEGSLA
jgi:hypothetical protein